MIKLLTILLLFVSLSAQAQWMPGMRVKKGQVVMHVTPWMALRDINKSNTPPSLKARGWWAPLKADYILSLLARIEELELQAKSKVIYADSAMVDVETKTITIYQ